MYRTIDGIEVEFRMTSDCEGSGIVLVSLDGVDYSPPLPLDMGPANIREALSGFATIESFATDSAMFVLDLAAGGCTKPPSGRSKTLMEVLWPSPESRCLLQTGFTREGWCPNCCAKAIVQKWGVGQEVDE